MATQQECEAALERITSKLTGGDSGQRDFDRSLSCHVPDLGVTFSGRLRDGRAEGLTTEPAPKAQIRFTVNSDDLVALSDACFAFGSAWSSKGLNGDAGFIDVLKLRLVL